MLKEYTIETRLEAPEGSDIRIYLDDFVVFYNKVYREMWHEMITPDHNKTYTRSRYISCICSKYGLLKRTVNSVYFDIQGRMNSYMELKKTEMEQLKIKISEKKEEIEEYKSCINTIKPSVAKNKASKEELEQYRKAKYSLYHAGNKLNRMNMKLKNLEYNIKQRIYSIGFGGKQMFKKQYHMEKNNYHTNIKWKNDYHKARDKNISYIGSNDETCGNQLLQLRYDDGSDTFSIRLRKEKRYCSDKGDRYIELNGLTFKYLHDELVLVCKGYEAKKRNMSPLTFRFARRKTRWYIQVIFKIETVEYLTRKEYGTIGLDYNDGFIESAETDEKGNLVGLRHYQLSYHGTGNKAKSEIEEAVSRIVSHAVETGKDIVIEDLDFKKKKSKVRKKKGKNREYNKMIHMFDYSRYKKTIENSGHRKKVGVIKVNPYNTSKIGKMKYSKKKKLTVHQAASYVIARRGQGYRDTI